MKRSVWVWLGCVLLIFIAAFFIYINLNNKEKNCVLSVRKHKVNNFSRVECGDIRELIGTELLYFGKLSNIWIKNDRVFLRVDFGNKERDFFIGFKDTTRFPVLNVNSDGYYVEGNAATPRLIVLNGENINTFLRSNKGKYVYLYSENPTHFDQIYERLNTINDQTLLESGKIYLKYERDFLTQCKEYVEDYNRGIKNSNFFGNLLYGFDLQINRNSIKCLPNSKLLWVFD